jgi:ADP-L-glycero-D-manno-heptose 6-epimerase
MYIVTGGAGFIGSAIVWALNRRGADDILIVDSLGSSEKWKNLRALKFADYMEKDEFRRLVRDGKLKLSPEVIFHMGACSATTETDASYLADNNYLYTKELAEFALSRGAFFIYASSAATYGDCSRGCRDTEPDISVFRPLNMYGYSKQMFDLWARGNRLLDKIAGMKFTNVFGPNEYHKGGMRSVPCKAWDWIRELGKITLFKSLRPDFADGEQKRDFLYIKDAVDMLMFVMDKRLTGIYNIGSGRAETWNSLARAVFSALEKPPVIEYIDMPAHLAGSYQYHTCADMSKLRSKGYPGTPVSLEASVSDYYRNYLVPGKHLGD